MIQWEKCLFLTNSSKFFHWITDCVPNCTEKEAFKPYWDQVHDNWRPVVRYILSTVIFTRVERRSRHGHVWVRLLSDGLSVTLLMINYGTRRHVWKITRKTRRIICAIERDWWAWIVRNSCTEKPTLLRLCPGSRNLRETSEFRRFLRGMSKVQSGRKTDGDDEERPDVAGRQRTRLIVEDISETSVTAPLHEMKHNSTSCLMGEGGGGGGGGVVIAAIYEFLNSS